MLKAVRRMSLDNPPKPYWIIEETVTPQGHTIVWPQIYSSEANALKDIENKKEGIDADKRTD